MCLFSHKFACLLIVSPCVCVFVGVLVCLCVNLVVCSCAYLVTRVRVYCSSVCLHV